MAIDEQVRASQRQLDVQDEVGTPSKEKGLHRWMSSALPASVHNKVTQHRQQDNYTPRPHDASQDYLVGVRGVVAIMAFLWTFLQTFVPAAVKGSANTTGLGYQIALRRSLSVLFWNDSMIYSSIIFLSARMICLPFLLDSSKTVLASSVVRRGLRLWFPVAASLIIVYAVFTKHFGGTQYLTDFATQTDNVSMNTTTLYVIPNSLANFNSIFETFWITHLYQDHAANWAFPTQTLWVISAVFQQSYTVLTAMVIVPYTRKQWRVLGGIGFVLTAWWVYSWAFYSIAGLMVADAVMNMGMRPGGTGSSLKLSQHITIPFWTIGLACMGAGYAMQFLWVAVFPDLQNVELQYHTGLYTTGGLNWDVDVTTAQMRADNWLVIVGFFLILETVEVVQKIFRNRVFIYLGNRSYSTLYPTLSCFLKHDTNLHSKAISSSNPSSSIP